MIRDDTSPSVGGPLPPRRPDVPPTAVLAYAGFGARFGALLTDILIFWISGGLLRGLFGDLVPDPMALGRFRLSTVLLAALFWTYLVLTTGLIGGTLGKRAFGLRVVSKEFGRPDWATVLFREVVGRIIVAGLFFVGYLWVAVDRRKQGWHDKIADTFVVKKVAGMVAPDPWETPNEATAPVASP
ncbi:MAG: RDD family protein [Actinomycetota bacterium]|nr:RDD family protein [Actinomycetota bacterium]